MPRLLLLAALCAAADARADRIVAPTDVLPSPQVDVTGLFVYDLALVTLSPEGAAPVEVQGSTGTVQVHTRLWVIDGLGVGVGLPIVVMAGTTIDGQTYEGVTGFGDLSFDVRAGRWMLGGVALVGELALDSTLGEGGVTDGRTDLTGSAWGALVLQPGRELIAGAQYVRTGSDAFGDPPDAAAAQIGLVLRTEPHTLMPLLVYRTATEATGGERRQSLGGQLRLAWEADGATLLLGYQITYLPEEQGLQAWNHQLSIGMQGVGPLRLEEERPAWINARR